jgi:hypothetical protein
MSSDSVSNDLLRRLRIERESRRKHEDVDKSGRSGDGDADLLAADCITDNFADVASKKRHEQSEKQQMNTIHISQEAADISNNPGNKKNTTQLGGDELQEDIDLQLAMIMQQEDAWADTFDDWSLPAISTESQPNAPALTDESIAPDAHEVLLSHPKLLDLGLNDSQIPDVLVLRPAILRRLSHQERSRRRVVETHDAMRGAVLLPRARVRVPRCAL